MGKVYRFARVGTLPTGDGHGRPPKGCALPTPAPATTPQRCGEPRRGS
jgi:hypothetical protein